MRGAALLLLACGCLARARAQEDDDIEGSLVQEVTEVAQGGVDNGNNDVAVAGIWHDDSLYTAVQTTAFLTGNANAGENDVVLIKFSVDLEEEEIVQFGSEGDDLVTAMAGNFEIQGDFVIVGSTASESSPGVDHLFDNMVNGTYDPDQDASSDWFIATIDRDTLEVTDSYVNGTLFENQQATAVAVDTEDSDTYYVAGWTWGEYFAENAGADNDEDDVGYDWWVVKINEFDQLVDPVWAEQGGSAAYDTPTAMVVDADAVYVVGTVRDDSNVLSTADEAEQTPIFVMALDVDDGDELWSASVDEVGTLADGTLAYGAVLSADGDELYVSGHTEGVLPDYDGDATDSAELFLISFDVSDGSVNWVWQSEGNATAFGRGGVVLAEDGSPIVAGIAFGNQFNLTYEYWEGGNGDMIAAKIDPDDLEVVKYFNAPAAYNMTREEPFAMVTDPDVEDGVFLIGQQDGDFLDEDVEPELDPDVEDDDDATAANLNNYLVLKVELTDFPDPVDDSSDDGPDYEYWPIGVAVFGIGIVLFYLAYKWAEHSKAAAAKMATMV